MSHTITLSFPVFQPEAKPSRIVAVRKPVATAVPMPTEKKRVFADSFADNVSTVAHCAFFLCLLTWMTVFVATVM